MHARAYAPAQRPSPADEFHAHTDFMRWELAPEERVGVPIQPRRKRWWLRGLALMALAGSGVSAYLDPAGTWAWTSAGVSSAISLGETLLQQARAPSVPAAKGAGASQSSPVCATMARTSE